MKKIILTVSVVGLIIISSIVVAAATGFGKLQLDENGKVIDPNPDKFENSSQITEETKNQIREKEENLKKNPPIVSSSDNNDDLSFSKQKEEAKKYGDYLRELFKNGIEITNKYSDKKLPETLESTLDIDRDMLEVMVTVLEDNLLPQSEANVLKQCLAEEYIIIRSTDPIYQRVNKILGIHQE